MSHHYYQVAGASMNNQHSYSILVTGIARFYLTKLLKEHPHPLALVEAVDESALVEGEHAFIHACSITYIFGYIDI